MYIRVARFNFSVGSNQTNQTGLIIVLLFHKIVYLVAFFLSLSLSARLHAALLFAQLREYDMVQPK